MIYLVEDDSNIREFVLYALSGQGMEARGFERPSRFFAALEQQLRQVERTGRPSGVMTQRYDTVRGTNDPTSAAIQLAEGLEAGLAEPAEREPFGR